MNRLNQVISVEKEIKGRTHSKLSELHHVSQKVDLYNGFTRKYAPKNEDGETYPNEDKLVQLNANECLKKVATTLGELFDITAIKDYTNCIAVANLEIDGVVLLENVPSTHLLFLEKQMITIRTFVEKLPELDPSEDWDLDVNSGLFKTKPSQTHKTKKVPKPMILAKATVEHPAQTHVITEDVTVGYWNMVKYSGALRKPKKIEILNKIDKLTNAIKIAREAANMAISKNVIVSDKIFKYLFD